MRLLALTFAALAVPASAHAEPVWDNVEFGMTRAQVEALHPESSKVDYQKKAIEISDIPIIAKCDAEVNIRFDDNDTVHQVMIAGNPSLGGRCSRDVLAALSAKYGEPLNRDSSEGSILARQGKIFTWNREGGITMQFKKFENGGFGGGGLGKASWELTYSKLGELIGL